jgi:fumarate reductase subunit D
MGWFVAIAAAIYCFWDSSSRRMKNPWLWAIFGALGTLFAIALLHGNRWLKEGESRSGGRGWDSCRWFAIFASIFFFLAGIAGVGAVSNQMTSSADSSSQAGTAIGATLGIGMIFFLWLFVSGGALIFGLMLKKDAKEIGPTGPLSTRV